MKLNRFERLVVTLLGLICIFAFVAACSTISGTNSVDTVQASENVQLGVYQGSPMVDAEGDTIAYYFIIDDGKTVCRSVVSVDSFERRKATGAALSCP